MNKNRVTRVNGDKKYNTLYNNKLKSYLGKNKEDVFEQMGLTFGNSLREKVFFLTETMFEVLKDFETQSYMAGRYDEAKLNFGNEHP